MATVLDKEPIEQTIHTVAVRRLGVVDTSIVPFFDRQAAMDGDGPSGIWFVVSVRLPGDVGWTLLGRRRTRDELLELVSTMDPQHLNGKRFP